MIMSFSMLAQGSQIGDPVLHVIEKPSTNQGRFSISLGRFHTPVVAGPDMFDDYMVAAQPRQVFGRWPGRSVAMMCRGGSA